MFQKGDQRGQAHRCAVLTEVQVRRARKLYWVEGVCMGCVAKLIKADVSRATLWDVLRYKTWRYLSDSFKMNEVTRDHEAFKKTRTNKRTRKRPA